MKKRILCMLLCIALLMGVFPTAVFAANDTVTANGTEVSVSGTNSVGTLLAKSLDGDGNDTDAYNCLQDITVENGAATVMFSAFEDAELVVAIYDEGTGRLTTSGKATVHKDDTKATIMLETSEIPQYFTAEAFLLSADDYTPLCESFSTPMYTKAFQELLDSSCDDFDADRVLNLDESKDTNFAVYSKDVKRSESNGTTNTVLAADDTALRYVINNPDSTVTSLRPGEFWSCEDGANVLIVKIASVTLQGNQAIITGQETSMEEVFDYAKIEGAADAGDAVIDASQMADGVTYNGMVAMEESPDTRAWNGEGSLKTGWSFSLYKEIKGDEASAKLNLSLNLSVTTKLKYYIAKSDSYISFTQEYKMSVKGELEDKLKLCEIALTLVPIVIPVCGVINIEIEPNFVVEFSATVSVDTSLTWSAGLTYTQGTGFTNTSTKPTTEAEFSIEGKLFIGVSVQIKFCIISSYICSIGIGFEAGAEVKAKLTGREQDNGKLHYCDGCLDGTIHIVFRLKASADLFKFLKISKTVAEVKLLLGDFYNSFTYHEGGWGDCPHWYEEGTEPDPTEPTEPTKPTEPTDPTEPSEVLDSGTCGENLTWTLDLNGVLTISGTGEMSDYSYSDFSGFRPAPWVSQWSNIKTVVIENGVTRIGDWAFADCTSLTSVTIPDSVTSIGEYSFYKCTSLTSVAIPNSVTSIGGHAFDCTSLTSVTIPNSVTSISDWAFSGCTSLTAIEVAEGNTAYTSESGVLFDKHKTVLYCYPAEKTETEYGIPDSVTSIGDFAFSGCTSLTSVTIPDSVTSIGRYAFYKCTSLTSVTIPSSVTSINDDTFSGCSSLTSVTIPDSVTSIGDWAFYKCTSLTSVTIPDGVTSIGWCAFYKCTSLTSVTIPDGVTSINDDTFSGCSSLTSVTIPSSVTSIGDEAFCNCTSLTSVTIPDGVTSINNDTFYGCSSLTSVTIPSSVTSIGRYAFCNCTSLTSVTIPDGVTSINDDTFSGCSSLTSVTIPSSVTSIGDEAFYKCTSLTSVTIPDSVTSIGRYAFYKCTSLTSVTIPDSVTSIGDWAFDWTGLTMVYFCGNAPSIGENAFYGVTATAYYPAGNSTWTDSVKQNYGGKLTWVEWTPSKGAQVVATTDTHEARGLHTGKQNGSTVSFSRLTAGEQYVLIVSKNKSSDLLERNNLLYIAQAPAGEDGTLQFTLVPRESYANAFIGLYGKGVSSTEQTPCDGGKGCPSGKFVDVNTKEWYHPYVDYAVAHGLFGGTGENTFEPETAMTRAMLVTVLWRYEGKPMGYQNTFSDVNAKDGSWYIDAVAWASANGVVNGVGNGRFDPEGKITREQMAAILFRYAEKKGINTSKRGNLGGFPDANQVSSYAKDAVQWAVGEGIINGSDGKLLPQGSATRAQVATILMRYIENIVKK